MKKVKFLILIFFIPFLQGCPKIHVPDTTTVAQVTIPAPPNYDRCYLTHAQSGAKIQLNINITSYYWYRTNGKTPIDDKSISFDPSTQTFPFKVSVTIPSDGSPVYIEANIQGKHCSECASGYSANDGPPINAECKNVSVGDGSYYGATPRWMSTLIQDTYSTTGYTMPQPVVISNVPGSCISCTR